MSGFFKWYQDLKGKGEGKSGLKISTSQYPFFFKLFLAGGVGVLLLVMGGLWGNPASPVDNKQAPQEAAGPVSQGPGDLLEMERAMGMRMEEIVSQMAGVGQVSVVVTLASGPEHTYAVNTVTTKRTVDEKDQGGGTRVTTEVNENGQLVLVKEALSGKEQPIVLRENRPEVAGVLVVAEGAKDARIKEQISRAVQTVLGIPANKVTVTYKESR